MKIEGVDFHDSIFKGIYVDGCNVDIFLSSAENIDYILKAFEVDRLSCKYFREGNIILDIEITSERDPALSVLAEIFDFDINDVPQFVKTRCEKISTGKMCLINIVPSFGAELIALCKTISLKPFQKT